jgi:hypothetical protein
LNLVMLLAVQSVWYTVRAGLLPLIDRQETSWSVGEAVRKLAKLNGHVDVVRCVTRRAS